MKKSSKQRTPADVELTNYHNLEVVFQDKKKNHLFSVRFERGNSGVTGDVYFDLHLGCEVPAQFLTIGFVNVPSRKGAKKKHVETITVDIAKSFDRIWHLTVNGSPRFSLQFNGETDGETLAFFQVLDEQENPITSFDIEQSATAKQALTARRQLNAMKRRADELRTVQDRREWENERFVELLNHFSDEPDIRALLTAILEAKAAPDDLDAQYKAICAHLAQVLDNPHLHKDLFNFIDDGLIEMQNSVGFSTNSAECLTSGFVGILHNYNPALDSKREANDRAVAAAREKGGEA